MDTEKLDTFIRLLQRIQKQPNKTFDLGLIVREPKSQINSEEIFNEVNKLVPIEKIIYNNSIFDEDVVEAIINIFEKEKWIFLEIKKDIGSLLFNQLKYLANFNSLQLIDYKGQDIFKMKMPKESRIIIFIERDFIENKISYPNFYTLFGPVLSTNRLL